MTRWKKDETEFNVSLSPSNNKDGSQSLSCRVPKIIVESLGSPRSIKFKLKKNIVIVESGD